MKKGGRGGLMGVNRGVGCWVVEVSPLLAW